MIQVSNFYFDIKINDKTLPISPKDIDRFQFSYGLLSTLPVWNIRFSDRASIAAIIYGSYPVSLTFGNTSEDVVSGDYSIVSNIDIQSGGFGGMGSGMSEFSCNHTSLLDLYKSGEPAAYKIPVGNTLASVYLQFGIEVANLQPVNRDIFVYKGVENSFNFLSQLALFTTDVKNTIGYGVYFDCTGLGKLISFLDKVDNIKFASCNQNGMVASETAAYSIFDFGVDNSVRSSVLSKGLYIKLWGGDIIQESERVAGDTNWLNAVPTIKAHVQDILDKGEPYSNDSRSVGFLSDIEEQFFDIYAANLSFWSKARTCMSHVVLATMIKDDLEPGTLIRSFNSATGANGIYAVLQKAFIVSGESDIYTKLWILNLKVFEE